MHEYTHRERHTSILTFLKKLLIFQWSGSKFFDDLGYGLPIVLSPSHCSVNRTRRYIALGSTRWLTMATRSLTPVNHSNLHLRYINIDMDMSPDWRARLKQEAHACWPGGRRQPWAFGWIPFQCVLYKPRRLNYPNMSEALPGWRCIPLLSNSYVSWARGKIRHNL